MYQISKREKRIDVTIVRKGNKPIFIKSIKAFREQTGIELLVGYTERYFRFYNL